MTRTLFLRTGIVLAAALPMAAFAAPPPMAPNHPAMSEPAATAPASEQSAQPLPKDMQQKLDAHIDSLHEELAITQAQEPQWKQFAQVMRENADSMHQAIEQRGTQMGSMNALENMQSYAQLARVHADNMQRLAASFETLYSSLSTEQKQQADSVFRHEEKKHEAQHKAG